MQRWGVAAALPVARVVSLAWPTRAFGGSECEGSEVPPRRAVIAGVIAVAPPVARVTSRLVRPDPACGGHRHNSRAKISEIIGRMRMAGVLARASWPQNRNGICKRATGALAGLYRTRHGVGCVRRQEMRFKPLDFNVFGRRESD